MKPKKLTALLLTALLLLPPLAACSNQSPNPNGRASEETADSSSASPADAAEAEETKAANPRLAIPDNLPEEDFDGRAFRVLTSEQKVFQTVSEDLTGEVTNDAVFNRNRRIEERFDVAVEAVLVNFPYEEITNYVFAGADECEITDHWAYKAFTPILAGSYLDWNVIPHIDQSRPWWNGDANKDATINGKIFCITGDLSITAMQYTFAFCFNIDHVNQFGYTASDFYNTVFEGRWTIDELQRVVETIYEDKNGNGKSDVGDVLGYLHTKYEGSDVWVTAVGEHPTQFVDGELVVTLASERVTTTLDKINRLVWNTVGSAYCDLSQTGDSVWADRDREIAANHVALFSMEFQHCFSLLRDMDFSYGLLPFPKFDEEQEKYYTIPMDQYSVFGIPKTMPKDRYDFLGIVMEALNAETYKTVFPAYYDVALKNKYSEDPETAQIVDIIMDGRVFEFSFQFGEYLADLPYMFRRELAQNRNNLVSVLKRNTRSINNKLKTIYGMYE